MSNEPRFLARSRRAAPDPVRPDYSEPDFSSWAAKLDAFIPSHAVEHEAETATATATVDAPADVSGDKPSSLNDDLEKMLGFDGAMCAALVDSDSGMVIGQSGATANLDIAAAGNTEVVRAQLKQMETLGLNDTIDDILITLTTQYDIVHPLADNPSVFLYLTMDKSKSNLALARYKVAECADQLVL